MQAHMARSQLSATKLIFSYCQAAFGKILILYFVCDIHSILFLLLLATLLDPCYNPPPFQPPFLSAVSQRGLSLTLQPAVSDDHQQNSLETRLGDQVHKELLPGAPPVPPASPTESALVPRICPICGGAHAPSSTLFKMSPSNYAMCKLMEPGEDSLGDNIDTQHRRTIQKPTDPRGRGETARFMLQTLSPSEHLPAAREARRSWGAVPVVPWGGTGGAAGGPAAC